MTLASPLFLLLLIPVIAGMLWAARLRVAGRRSMLWLRFAAIVVLVIALAQPELSASRPPATTVVVDRSDGISPAMVARERSWIRALRSSGGCAKPCRVVEFAGDARLVGSGSLLSRHPQAVAEPGATSIQRAIELAVADTPRGGRVVLLSGGLATTGAAATAAAAARAQDVRIDTVELGADSRPDAAVTRFQLPAAVHAGDQLAALITIHSTVARRATLALTLNGSQVGHQTLALHRGDNPLSFTLSAPAPGWHVYRAQVTMPGDVLAANDALDATVDVSPAPRVLMVSSGDPAAGAFARTLRTAGFRVVQSPPRGLARAAARLRADDAVVLDDVPASALARGQVNALSAAVARDGVGLLVLGGPHGLSLGGYSGSALERILPVSSVPPANRQRGTAGIELVLDRSGSMIDEAGGVPKIQMARAGARIVARFAAKHLDDLGIVSFDTNPHLLVSLQRISPGIVQQEVDSEIDTLTANGGTNIYGALKAGTDELLRSTAPNRHMILMTDGISQPANYTPLLDTLKNHNISVSTVALGADADHRLLRFIAAKTRGRYYATSDANQLPLIFAKEARLSVKPVSDTGTLPLSIYEPAPAVAGLLGRTLKPLHRNVVTDLKHGATPVIIGRPRREPAQPVLSQWQYGLGRVAVWSSSAQADWSGALGTDPALWNDTLRWLERSATTSPLAPTLTATEPLQVVVDPLANGGTSLDLAHLTGTVTAPGFKGATLRFTQVAPSRYTAPLPAGLSGNAAQITVSDGQAPAVTAVVAVPYPLEDLPRPTGPAELARLASIGGGRRLAVTDTGALSGSIVRLWPWLTALALLLFLAGAAAGLFEPRRRRGESEADPRERARSTVLAGQR